MNQAIEDRAGSRRAIPSSETVEELYRKLERLSKGLRRVFLQLELRGEYDKAVSLAQSLLKGHPGK